MQNRWRRPPESFASVEFFNAQLNSSGPEPLRHRDQSPQQKKVRATFQTSTL
jgi:hypothetical protein